MNYIIKEATVEADGALGFDLEDIVVKARLWVDGVGTNWFMLVGDFPVETQKPVRPQDTAKFNGELNRVFAQAKVALSDYGVSKRRRCNLDIHVSQAVLDGYTG